MKPQPEGGQSSSWHPHMLVPKTYSIWKMLNIDDNCKLTRSTDTSKDICVDIYIYICNNITWICGSHCHMPSGIHSRPKKAKKILEK